MTIRRFVTPTIFALALVVGLLAAPAFGQDPDAHVPSPAAEEEVDVAGVVLERAPVSEEAGVPVGAEVLGVTLERPGLAVTGTDTFLLAAIGIALVGLGIVAFWAGRRPAGREVSDTGR